MRIVAFFLLFAISMTGLAQEPDFPFGQVTYRELTMDSYPRDTAARAVVLKEFGEAYIQNDGDYNLIFNYHVKIKIFTKQGVNLADYIIPLHKQESQSELLLAVEASSFNVENGSIKEAKVDRKNIFTQDLGKWGEVKKFAIPNVREGTVIEIKYQLESPFIYNFREWEFQSEIPKMYSEFWARIPGNYVYNMSLRGFLKLSKDESSLEKDCFSIGSGKADCAVYKLAMTDIPAFVEEDYMLAPSNYIAAINFELSQVKFFDGRVVRYTEEWEDADLKLKRDEKFGIQLKRGKDIAEQIEHLISPTDDNMLKAKKVYAFIKDWYSWDDMYSKYSEYGIRKAFDSKKGNVGDINLSLIAALRFAGLSADPVILSTRKNGLPREIHPVLSDFNYVIAKVNLGNQSFFLDATDDFYPFGVIPERCLNGKGRWLSDDGSSWIELKVPQKNKRISSLNLKLSEDGALKGTLVNNYYGYEAVSARKKFYGFSTEQEYVNDVKNKMTEYEVSNVKLQNTDDIDKPLIETLEIELLADVNNGSLLFNPFLANSWRSNPFKSSERLYPVDFGVPIEHTLLITIEYPPGFEIVNIPEKVGLSLPNAGGRFIADRTELENKLTISCFLQINKPVFSAAEYHYLKELFSSVVRTQSNDLLLKKKQ
jgi:hypothetical protein